MQDVFFQLFPKSFQIVKWPRGTGWEKRPYLLGSMGVLLQYFCWSRSRYQPLGSTLPQCLYMCSEKANPERTKAIKRPYNLKFGPSILQRPFWRKSTNFTLCRRAASGRRRCFEEWRPGPVGAAAGIAIGQECQSQGKPWTRAAGQGWAPDAMWYSSGKGFCTHRGFLHCRVYILPLGYGRALNTLCWSRRDGE